MLAVSRLAISNLRIAQPRVAPVLKGRKCIAVTFPAVRGQRWFSKKVNDMITRQVTARRNRLIAAGSNCYTPGYPGCSAIDGRSKTGSIDTSRTPLIGQEASSGDKPIPERARSAPVVEHTKPNCEADGPVAKSPRQPTHITGAPPSCPPPSQGKIPPSGPDYTPYIVGGLALTVGGLGLAYKMGLFDGNQTAQQEIIEPAQVGSRKSKNKTAFPASSKDLPKEVPYLLIGGGTASFAAFRAIKGHDARAKVLVISNEPEMPYMRPPLSKELWFSPEDKAEQDPLRFRQWNGVERSIYYEPDDFYIDPDKLLDSPNGGVAIARGYVVHKIDVVNRKAILTDGTEIKYGECLLATGSKPKNLPVFETATLAVKDRLTLFKSVNDFEQLNQKLKPGDKVAVVGGGFLGSELSCALAKHSQIREKRFEVHQLFHEEGNMGKILPEYLSQWTTDRVREEGVKVWTNTQIKAADVLDKKLVLTLTDDSRLVVDHAIVAVGSEPNTELAKTSNLEIDPSMGGFVVDAELRARSHLYVAGDAACFFDPKLGRRRVEHHDHAVVSGRLAGENMAGLNKPYTHQSMFWSDLGPKIRYEAIGIIDAALPTVGVFAKISQAQTIPDTSEKLQAANATIVPASNSFSNGGSSVLNANVVKADTKPVTTDNECKEEEKDDFNKGVIFYLRDEKVVGVLLWNIFNRIPTARKIVAQHTSYEDLNEVAKLFNLHEFPDEEEDVPSVASTENITEKK